MKRIDKNELYQNLRGFLKTKGVALEEGPYDQRIRQGCHLLTDAINATRKTVSRAKVQVDVKLDQLRESIHQATAKPPPAPPSQKSTASSEPAKVKPGRGAKPPASRAHARRRKT